MSYDNDSTLHTLTPRGWVTDDHPPDAIETWVRAASQASGWSREYVSWSCQWANPNVPRAERDTIRAKHREFMGRPGRFGDRETTIGDPL
jgi:hypothetical protein